MKEISTNMNSKDKPKKVSMQSVADAAGVARSTVSFVLNGKEKEARISEKVAKRIRMIAHKMDYQVNEVARMLRTGRTNTIALVVANISDIFFGYLAYCFQEYAETKGYTVIIFNTGEKLERLKAVFRMLDKRRVDGILMVPVANTGDGLIENLNPGIPMVVIDRYFKELTTSRVIINNFEVSKMAAQLLVGKGCRKIMLVAFREELMHMKDRKRGYMTAMSECKILDERLICEVDYFNYQEEILDFMNKTFSSIKGIDGLLIASGHLSSFTLRCLIDRGVKLQSDIQIISFGKIDAAVGVSIPYVKQPTEDVCKHAFDILINQMKAPDNTKLVDCVLPAYIVTD
jgi:LacI family transcriptional regulator